MNSRGMREREGQNLFHIFYIIVIELLSVVIGVEGRSGSLMSDVVSIFPTSRQDLLVDTGVGENR